VVEKEGYVVTLYFSQEVKDVLIRLQEYRKANNIVDCGYVFIAKDSGCDTYHKADNVTLWRWCKRIGMLIGIPELHPHDFRHTGATLLKNRGMALEDISTLLNHKSTDVTNKFYIKADKKAISQNKDKFEL
jgi:integrase